MRLIDTSEIHSRFVSAEQVPILQLDITGTPQNWITPLTAAKLICTGDVAWSTGDIAIDLNGGFSRLHQRRSHMEVPAIVATKGQGVSRTHDSVPPLTNLKLFARDLNMCAYCGVVHRDADLTREHIHPVSLGGPNVWTNVVAACKPCNNHKGARTPEQAGLQLLYLPYAPNLFEDFLLRKRHILADQMAYLMARVPDGSRARLS